MGLIICRNYYYFLLWGDKKGFWHKKNIILKQKINFLLQEDFYKTIFLMPLMDHFSACIIFSRTIAPPLHSYLFTTKKFRIECLGFINFDDFSTWKVVLIKLSLTNLTWLKIFLVQFSVNNSVTWLYIGIYNFGIISLIEGARSRSIRNSH